jgi:PAS domain S-box-containing protein
METSVGDGQLLFDVVEDLPDAVAALDRQARVLYVNLTAVRLIGKRASELVGNVFWDAAPEVLGPALRPAFERVLAGEKVLILRATFAEGRWYEVVAHPHGDRVVLFGRDITERLEAEAMRRQSEERFRLLVDGVKEYSIVLLDPKGQVASWNVGAERLFGYSRDQILGQPSAVLYPQADKARARKNLEDAVANGRQEDEGWRVRSDGECFFANVVFSPLYDEVGQPAGFSVVTRDITEKRRMEDELRTSAERLRLAVDAGEVGTWECLLRNKIWTPDARCLALFGFTSEDAQPHTPENVLARIHPADREQASRTFDDAIASAGSYKVEYRVASGSPGDERWLESAGKVLSEGDKPHRMLGVVHDVTARHRYDEFRKLLPGIIAHDVRSPLSTIKMAGTMIQRSSEPSPSTRRYAQTMLRGADQIGRMAERLLDFTQARFGGGLPLERTSLDLAEVCSEIVAAARIAAPESKIALRVDGDARGAWDGTRLSEVVSNLVGNAIKHGPAGDFIDVVVRGDGEYVVLSIHNSGAPIPADLLPVLFDPFRRAEGTGQRPGVEKSYGLGLYISRELVVAHGGTIEVRSSAAQGTTFTVRLPRGAQATSSAGAHP